MNQGTYARADACVDQSSDGEEAGFQTLGAHGPVGLLRVSCSQKLQFNRKRSLEAICTITWIHVVDFS